MKISRKFFCIIFILCLISCSPNVEVLKKQAETSRNLGEAYMGQGDYTSGLKELLKAEEFYADDPYLQNDLGLAYMGKEKPDVAIEHFKKAVALSPDFAPARNNLGTAYPAKKDWDSAISAFKEVTSDILYATPHYPLSNLGLAYYSKEEYKTAEKYYLESLKIKPDFVIALRGLGRTCLALEKYSQAVDSLEKAAGYTTPQSKINPEIYFDLGKAYSLSENKKKAVDAFRKVIVLAPDSPLSEEAKKEVDKISDK